MSRDILVTGSDSMIGDYLGSLFSDRCILLDRNDLDISDTASFEACLERYTPKAVVNTAGNAGGGREAMFFINALYPAGLAEICETKGIPFYYLSSARVFGKGHEKPFAVSDCPCPVDDYGIAKYSGELLVRSAAPSMGRIVRLPMVLGNRKKYQERQVLFRLYERSMRGESVSVASDVVHSPVYAGDAASGIVTLIDENAESGIYHLSGDETVSLYRLYCDFLESMTCTSQVSSVRASDIATGSIPVLNHTLKSSWDISRPYKDMLSELTKDISG